MDWKTYERAMELYAQLGNLSAVHRQLQKEGLKKAYSTICLWHKENQDEWEKLREKYRDNKKTKFVESLGDTLFQEMVEINELLLRKVKAALASDDPKINTQGVITLQRQVDSVLHQLETREKESNKNDREDSK